MIPRLCHLALGMLLALLFATPAAAQLLRMEDRPRLVVELSPQDAITDGVFAGTQIILHIQVLSPHPFATLDLVIPEPAQVETVALMRPRTGPFATWGAEGHRHERMIALFPASPGKLVIPSITVTGTLDPGDGRRLSFEDRSTPVELTVREPMAELSPWLASPGITIAERWSIEPEDLAVGDVTTRTVTLEARGLRARDLPGLRQRRVFGIGVFKGTPARSERTTRDGVTAILEQSFELAIESPFPVVISPISLRYFDTAQGRIASAFVPGRRIEPLAPDLEARRAALMAEADAARERAGTVLAGLGIILAILLAGPVILLFWVWCPDHGDRRFARQLRSATSPSERLRALETWRRRGEEALDSQAIRELEAHLFGRNSPEPARERLITAALTAGRDARKRKLGRRVAQLANRLLGAPSSLVR